MLRRLLRHPRTQAALAALLGLYLAVTYRTLRWRLVGTARVAEEPAFVLAFWHEHLPLMSRLALEARAAGRRERVHVLVSRHRDGRFIGEAVGRFGLEMVHASSSRGGGAGLLALVRLARRGAIIAITPDGPRGPRRVAAAGVAHLSELARVPVLPAAACVAGGIRLRSWDRMVVPLPFGRAALAVGAPVPPGAGLAAIAAGLDAACAEAERALSR